MPVPARRGSAVDRRLLEAPPTLADLYRDHFEFVVTVARRLAGRALSAEDVAQEVFLVVRRRLHTFEPRAQVTTWLYGITFNIVRSMRRRLLLERSYRADESEGLDVAIIERDPIEVRQACDAAAQILATMSARKREVFLFGELDELSCAEIARIVGVKEATVWSRLHYARREFAAKVERLRRTESNRPSEIGAHR